VDYFYSSEEKMSQYYYRPR